MAFRAIGLLHPGEMGAALCAPLVADHEVWWVPAGRSPASAGRAAVAGFEGVPSTADLRERCDLIVSVCPPHAALATAGLVAGFRGVYLDANAVAPATAVEIASVIEAAGGSYVDGGIIGPPPAGRPAGGPAGTRLYLSGAAAGEVSEVFSGVPIEVRVLPGDASRASALKMCFAAWTKGSSALLLAVRALAEALGQSDALVAEWDVSNPDLPERSARAAGQARAKGWRWKGEMDQIARTFRDSGLPDGFPLAAADVFGRVGRPAPPAGGPADLTAVIDALIAPGPE